jgi:proteasome accessory factor C
MPKRTKISGADKYNLMLALVGYLVHTDEPTLLSELAERFQLTEAEVEDAVRIISFSGVGKYGGGELFDIYVDDFDGEKTVVLTSNPAIDDVPRISARQVAALSAGLNYLAQIPGFEQKSEIQALLDILAKGSTSEPIATLDVIPGSVDSDVLILRKAISEQVRIRCVYRNAKGETAEREIDPLLLVSKDDIWTLRGYCLKNHEVRAFRLDRMQKTEIMATPICQEAHEAELTEEIYIPKESDIDVTLELEPEAFSIIGDYQAVPLSDLPNGNLQVRIKVGNLNTLGPLLARFGGSARVLAPEDARVVVRNFALRALGESTQDEQVAE